MDPSWYAFDIPRLVGTLVSTLGIYLALIVLVRLNGLRSFSKMSSYDFAITVAIGSVLASTILSAEPTLTHGAVALAALLGWQRLLSTLRTRFELDAADNAPLLLMRGREILHANLRRAQVTEDDLYGKLREANVLDLDQVRAVVMEATGDISVLHGSPGSLSPELLRNVEEGDAA